MTIRVRSAFTLLTYAIVLTGILSLSIAEGSPLVIVLATALSLLAWRRAERDGRAIGHGWTNFLVFLVVLCLPLDYLLVTADPVLTVAHFLLAVQIVKLFGKKEPRDYVQLYVISLMHLGVAAVITIELGFSLAFLVYMLAGTWTLVLFLLVRELGERAPDDPAVLRGGARLMGGVVAVSIGLLGLTTFFFFAFPRFSAAIFDLKRGRTTQRLSGFDGDVDLDDLTAIKQDSTAVMRVHPDVHGRLPAEPKWRGLAFDRYEDGRWTRTWAERPPPERLSRRATALPLRPTGREIWRLHRPGRPDPPEEDLATLTITLEPLSLGASTIFAAPEAESIEFLSPARPTGVHADLGDTIVGRDFPEIRVRYQVVSAPPERDAAREAPVVPGGALDGIDYLQVPEGGPGARLRALAAEVVTRARARTPYEKAAAIERFLQAEYRYTLDLEPAPEGVDPIEHFLFTKKEGHCELSATAFVLMCRTEGIPARLVNGFQTGQWNEYARHWLVRQMDAHAWAEVHFQAGGAGGVWLDFDPTPWSAGGGFLSALEKLRDYVETRWINYVITFKLSDQLSFAERVRQRLGELRKAIVETLGGLREHLPKLTPRELARIFVAVGGGFALAAALAWLGLARRRARSANGGRGRRARRVPFFEELVRALERRGLKRGPAETALEWVRRAVRDAGLPLAPASEVVAAFYRVRFGDEDLTAAESARVEAALEALKAPAQA